MLAGPEKRGQPADFVVLLRTGRNSFFEIGGSPLFRAAYFAASCSHLCFARATTRGTSASSRNRCFARSRAAASILPRYACSFLYRSSIESRGSPDFSRSALVLGNRIMDPVSGYCSVGAPIEGLRRFQPM